MSNYSCVIVTFSGVDDEVKDGSAHSKENRAKAIREAYNKLEDFGIGTMTEPFVAGDKVGHAGECVVVYHCNGFDPEGMLKVLTELPWKLPVQLFWKDEEMDIYGSHLILQREADKKQ